MGRPQELLTDTLSLAVPLWIDRLMDADATARDALIRRWAVDAADAVASRGDVLQYGGRPGDVAGAFNAMARGVAALAFCPGGRPVPRGPVVC